MSKDLIMNLISDNRTQEALRILKEQLAEHDLQIEVILLSRRLESLNQKVRLGVIEDRERNKEENQINGTVQKCMMAEEPKKSSENQRTLKLCAK